jgi:hypothetical protein
MPDTLDPREKASRPIATPREPVENEVLRPRPVEGKIDHAELTRRIIARFPKILAALAK